MLDRPQIRARAPYRARASAWAMLGALGLWPRAALAADRPGASDPPPPDRVEIIPDSSEPRETVVPPIKPEAAEPAPPESAAPPRPPPPPPPEESPLIESFELHGFVRQSFELGFSGNALREDERDPTALVYDRVVGRSQMFLRARYSRRHWFEADVSGLLGYSLFEQGPSHASTPFDGFNGQSARGVLEPTLYEAFLGLYSSVFDFRIGQQRVAWGKGDFVSPNDVMNARDARDPFVAESELRHLPTFMARGDLDMGFATLETIIAPVFTPDRFDVYGSNWAAIQPDAPVWARGLANLVQRSIDPSLQEQEQRLIAATRYPRSNFTQPVFGARWTWNAGSIDLSHYYQYGFDGPLLAVDPGLLSTLTSFNWATTGLADLQPWLAAIDAGQSPLRATYVRRHHVGADAAVPVGPLVFKLDAAYQSQKVFFRRDLLGISRPAFQGVLSIEYQTGQPEKNLLLEGIYLHVLNAPREPLLIYERNTSAIAFDWRWPLVDPVSFELRALFGIQPQSALVQPQLNFGFDPLVLSLGGLWLGGEDGSLGAYFRRNRELYVKANYPF